MHQFRNPLIALSLEEPDVALLHYAKDTKALSGCDRISFAHAIPSDRSESKDAWRDAQAKMHARISRHFSSDLNGGTVHVTHGPRLDEILSLAAELRCDLIMLGQRQDRAGRRSFSRRLAMIAPCSVWVVPEGSETTLRRILVPVDFSAPSLDALSAAAAMAADRSLKEILAVHVFFEPSTSRYDENVREIQGREREAFESFVAKADLNGVRVTPFFEENSEPGEGILDVARREKADLIVMSTRGRSRASAILLGSVTSATMATTRIPLLAVKHFGSRMSVLEAILEHRHGEESSVKTH